MPFFCKNELFVNTHFSMRAPIFTCARKIPCFFIQPHKPFCILRSVGYLRSLSLHTVKNCAKITCIGLFPYDPFFISIFLYKEVFRYESFK